MEKQEKAGQGYKLGRKAFPLLSTAEINWVKKENGFLFWSFAMKIGVTLQEMKKLK